MTLRTSLGGCWLRIRSKCCLFICSLERIVEDISFVGSNLKAWCAIMCTSNIGSYGKGRLYKETEIVRTLTVVPRLYHTGRSTVIFLDPLHLGFMYPIQSDSSRESTGYSTGM